MAVAVVDVQVNGQNAVRNLQQINAASKATEAGVQGLKNAVTGLVGAFSAVQALKFVIAKTSEIETQTRSLQTLTGSVEKAKQIVSELQQLGAVTPFTSTELIDAAKRLQAFGVEADKVVETTRRLADVSGATGAELQGLVTAYGQVQAKGRLQGEELLQFQERGIGLQEELRRMYNLTGDEFQKALSKGRISAEAVQVAIVNLTEAGGKYANGAIAQSSTLAGKFSTLQDNVEQLARILGQRLQPVLSGILDTANRTIGAISKVLSGGFAAEAAKLRTALVFPGGTLKDLQNLGNLIQNLSPTGADVAGLRAMANEIFAIQNLVAKLPAGALGPAEQDLAVAVQRIAQQKINELQAAQTALTKVAKPTATAAPPLLGDDTKTKTRAKTVDELLGGQVQRTLELNKAQLGAVTATRMNAAALQDNSEQAKRMVEFASKYQGIQLEINALEDTITKRTAIRSQLLAEAKDKQSVALAFDEQTKDLQNAVAAKRLEINTLTAQHIGQVNQLAVTEAKKLESITEEGQYLQNIILYGEEEAAIRQKINSILKDTSTLDAKAVEDAVRRNSALTQQIDAAGQLKQVYQDIGMSIKSGVVDAITSAIDGTKTLGEVANNVMKNIANKLIDVAINMALFGVPMGGGKGGGLLGGLFRANGGSVMAGQSYVVGERGPELFTPGRSGSIAPNGAMGGSNIVVNVDATGTSVQGNADDSKRLGAAIGAAVQAELIKQKRPGGLLA